MRRTQSVRIMLAAGVLILASGRGAAMDAEPIWLGTPFLEGWVPESAETVRGVLILDGWPWDARWQEACRYWKFAILRINSDKYGSTLPDDPNYAPLAEGNIKASAVKKGLAELARRTGHPEIVHVPIVSSGFSRYSQPAASYQAAFPGRALCFINGHSGGGNPGPDDRRGQLLWRQTPSIGLQCEWENIFSGGDKTRLLDHWWRRPKGNLAAAAIFWRVYHDPKTFADLGIVFIDQVIRARISANWDPRTGPCKLKPVRFEAGWLGSHAGWRVPVEKVLGTFNESAHIAPAAEFEGDRERASWLISEELAWAWRAFSSRYPKARIVAPGHSNLVLHQDADPPPTGHLECGVRAGERFRAAVQAGVADLVKVEFFAGTTPLGETNEFSGGQWPLGNTMDAVAGIDATIDTPGVTALMARYTTSAGQTGWTRPMPLVVWPDGAGR